MPPTTQTSSPPPSLDDFMFTFETSSADMPPVKFTHGSFHYDLASGKYPLRWASLAEMCQWIKDENHHTIELHRKEHRRNRSKNSGWTLKHIYVCSRQGSRSISKYAKKTTWGCKVPSKHIITGCHCCLTVKMYPGMDEVLGCYLNEHSHPTGDANARFIRIPEETRLHIVELLRMGIDPARVLKEVQGHVHSEDHLNELRSRPAARNEFVTAANVRHIQKDIEAESIQLGAQDGQSTREWVARLRERGELLGYKRSSDAPPVGPSLAPDMSTLCIQTKYQSECWKKWGGKFAGLDATHNTMHYEGMSLFTIMVRSKPAQLRPGEPDLR
ncbi:hypothetical protein FB451DRAFT_1446379 [Mycena latifolia]|nr:hypothetical protein FB451DRAFT_1446379 [Mycena latifolia]